MFQKQLSAPKEFQFSLTIASPNDTQVRYINLSHYCRREEMNEGICQSQPSFLKIFKALMS